MVLKSKIRYNAYFLLIISFIFLTCSLFRISEFHITVGDGDVSSNRGMVASAHPLASQAGIDILKQGGNAIDAAVATAFALSVVEPNASGLGGGGFLLVKMKDQPPLVIDYREVAPALVTKEFYYHQHRSFEELTAHGGASIAVPGMLAGLKMALDQFGSKSIPDLLKPAQRLAEEGFIIDEKLSRMILDKLEVLTTYEAAANIFLQDYLPREKGVRLKRNDLVKTFKIISKNGVKEFYEGMIAKSIEKAVKENNGLLTLQDLTNYQAIQRQPILGSYNGFKIITVPSPSSGGIHLVQLLNILEHYDLKKWGHNSTKYIHIFCEAAKQIYADREKYAADPAFYDIPVKTLISKQYAKDIRKKISIDKINRNVIPGELEDFSSNTTHLSVVDEMGNLVALTQTINHFFGSGIMAPEWGILLNNEMSDFSSNPDSKNAVEPGKRPVSYIAPILVFKNGQSLLSIGTPGGSRIITALAQIIINIIDFNMSIDAAVEAPRFHCQTDIIYVENRIDSTTVNALRKLGHEVKVRDAYDVFFGGAQGILIDNNNGRLLGGADSRRSGVAIGY